MDKHVWNLSVPWSRRRIKWIVIKVKCRGVFQQWKRRMIKKGKRAAKRSNCVRRTRPLVGKQKRRKLTMKRDNETGGSPSSCWRREEKTKKLVICIGGEKKRKQGLNEAHDKGPPLLNGDPGPGATLFGGRPRVCRARNSQWAAS